MVCVFNTTFALLTYYSWNMWLLHLVKKEGKEITPTGGDFSSVGKWNSFNF